MIEDISHNQKLLAKIIRSKYLKKKGINFFTPNKFSQQVAFMNHPRDHNIQPHLHRKNLKKIYDTCEVLIIINGILKVDFYNKKKKLFSKKLYKNDIIILLRGGHGFKTLNNCQFIEVKQGPYNIKKDKIKF